MAFKDADVAVNYFACQSFFSDIIHYALHRVNRFEAQHGVNVNSSQRYKVVIRLNCTITECSVMWRLDGMVDGLLTSINLTEEEEEEEILFCKTNKHKKNTINN